MSIFPFEMFISKYDTLTLSPTQPLTHSLSLSLSVSISLSIYLSVCLNSRNFLTITCTASSCRSHFYCSLCHNYHDHDTKFTTRHKFTHHDHNHDRDSLPTVHRSPITVHRVRLWSLCSNLNTKFITAQPTVHLSYKFSKLKNLFCNTNDHISPLIH